jgi:hypothetical protein
MDSEEDFPSLELSDTCRKKRQEESTSPSKKRKAMGLHPPAVIHLYSLNLPLSLLMVVVQ